LCAAGRLPASYRKQMHVQTSFALFLSAFVQKILIFSNIVLSTTLGTMTVFIGIFSGDFVSGFLRVLDCFYPLKYYFHPLLFRMLGRPHSCCEHGGKGKYL
jgi:hypothetical protein